ncbi:hypothetical protein HPB47_000985 [Ixodes persulcatus]|uniref:Uncharacterized protein n=1 Tax=Ixodes persulcatus TaxID=34615 RepID=A0AC60PQB1_IXOPE|nr:hypothetical protein HPB47_000985 [Ixodes persulcatus]
MDFHQQKTKVSLAAQTLSRSTSCALLFCKEKHIPGFEGVEATAEFAAVVDDTLDLTNLIYKASRYLRGLKDTTGRPLIQGPRKTAILRFMLALQSVKGLAEDLVSSSSPLILCLLAHKLSQDHFEMFFATIRNRTGNNNPMALEFRLAYRKCLIANVLPSSRGNFQADTSQNDDDATWVVGYKPLSEIAENIVQYIAGNVAVYFAKEAKFPDCARIALLTTDKCDLVRVKDNGEGASQKLRHSGQVREEPAPQAANRDVDYGVLVTILQEV